MVQDVLLSLQMAVESKNATKCTSYFVRKCAVLVQKGSIFGISASKVVRNEYSVSFSKFYVGRCFFLFFFLLCKLPGS